MLSQIAYEEIRWPGATATKRIFSKAEYAPRKIFLLELRLKDREKNLEQSKLHTGCFKFRLKKMSLASIKNAKQIFWSIDPNHLEFHEIAICPPNESITPIGFNKDGILKILLFQGKAGSKD